MIACIRRIVFLAALFALAAPCQLYLLTGYPDSHPVTYEDEGYPSSLLMVDGLGHISVASALVAQPPGTFWIGVSYEARKAVLVPGHAKDASGKTIDDKVLVLDFDKAEIVKTCPWPMAPDTSLLALWLTDQPGLGPSFQWNFVHGDLAKNNFIRGMLLDPARPCADSLWTPQPEDVRNITKSGEAGAGGTLDRLDTRIGIRGGDPTGSITTSLGRPVPLGYQVPDSLREVPNLGSLASLLVNNQHVFATTFCEGPCKAVYFRKSDKTWHTLSVPGNQPPSVRGFGKYLAATELWTRSGLHPANAGEKDWRAVPEITTDDFGLPSGDILQPGPSPHLGRFALPGHIYIVDIDSGQQFLIDTKQADSEVLLIEDDVVYYRAADHLYSAKITGKGLEPAQLLAADDAIRDAHWAFRKH
jgi:hypothetical protein